MTAEEFRKLLDRNGLRQVDAAWMCGIGERHARSLALGEFPIPQYVATILMAYDEGLITASWLVRRIDNPVP